MLLMYDKNLLDINEGRPLSYKQVLLNVNIQTYCIIIILSVHNPAKGIDA